MLQAFLPLSIDLWIFKIEPQVIKFSPKCIDIFWGGVDLPVKCRYTRVTLDYLEENQFNQQYWLSISPTCVCGTPLYYMSLQKKKAKVGWTLVSQSLFEYNSDTSQSYPERYYGNEDGSSPFTPGCSISWPFDTRVDNFEIQRQLDFWSFGSETSVGNRFDFQMFNEDATPICEEFSCSGREPGWYIRLVLKDVSPDVSPSQPTLPPSLP